MLNLPTSRADRGAVLLGALLLASCGSIEGADSPGATPSCNDDTLPGFERVTAETEDPYFSQASQHRIELADGVETTPAYDEAGALVALRLGSGDDGGGFGDPALLFCGCPGGCRPVGTCSWGRSGRFAVCGGDCQTDNQSCFGCRFYKSSRSLGPVIQ